MKAKRPTDYPRRPLSAYNIFFREARAELLTEQARSDNVADTTMGFENIAKTIGAKWKGLSADDLKRYKEEAQVDTERYRREMDAYHRDLAVKGRQEREAMLCRQQSDEPATLPPSQAAPRPDSAPFPADAAQFLAFLQQHQQQATTQVHSEPEPGFHAQSRLLNRFGDGGESNHLLPQPTPTPLNQGGGEAGSAVFLPNITNTPFAQELQYLVETQRQNQQQQKHLALLQQFCVNQQQQHTNAIEASFLASLPPYIQQQLFIQAFQNDTNSQR